MLCGGKAAAQRISPYPATSLCYQSIGPSTNSIRRPAGLADHYIGEIIGPSTLERREARSHERAGRFEDH